MEQKLGAPAQLTPAMLKESKTFECDCGGKMFEEAVFFKIISAIISPTGKQINYPIGVIVCKKCGKVPTKLNKDDMVPAELLATSLSSITSLSSK
jgi:hypothetical protein